MKIVYAIITILMLIAFATVGHNLEISLDCFIASVFIFIGALPMMEKGVPFERED